MEAEIQDSLDRVRGWLAGARHACALTGAGISAESGIPTFRGAGGLWRQFRAEELATPQAFARDPRLVWEWYDWRRGIVAGARANPGHHALAALESRLPRFTLITQNVDGLHRRAGSRNPIELHGSIWKLRCTRCSREHGDDRVPLPHLPPHCDCGGLLRPGVVWFGEGLEPEVWHNAHEAVRSADLLLVIGTSAVVYPAASLAPLARASGARVVEINAGETPLTAAVDCTLRGLAGEILPRLAQ
ncbi:MAG: NAD-dependent deacylase [Acidobacteria bacterium]|nr:NAD-dependent deacylase [Acidobacteriota bacterium]MBI3279268.1 NAD-dependent deacylase [Acidobacteriota bacterium]